jgi:cytochrome P450
MRPPGGKLLESLRAIQQCPVSRSEAHGGLWLVTRYDDLTGALRDWETFTSTGNAAIPLQTPGVEILPSWVDPPQQHRELRSVLDRQLGPKQMPHAEEIARRVAAKLIDDVVSPGACEFVKEYTSIYSTAVLLEYSFGLTGGDVLEIAERVDKIHNVPEVAAEHKLILLAWVRALIAKRRATGGDGGGDILDSILTSTAAEHPLSEHQCEMIVMNVLLGGAETTGQAIGSLVARVAGDDELQRRLRADPELLVLAIEEVLRLEPPVPAIGRATTCPARVGDVAIPADQYATMFIAAANRDPDKYDRPDEFVVDRFGGHTRPHLTFGTGPHRCPGARLARVELRHARGVARAHRAFRTGLGAGRVPRRRANLSDQHRAAEAHGGAARDDQHRAA